MILPPNLFSHRSLVARLGRAVLVVMVCSAAVGRSGALAQSSWESTPYRVDVVLAIEDTPELNGVVASDLKAGLKQQIDAVIGPNWSVRVRPAEIDLHWQILDSLESISPSAITPEQLGMDKVLMIAVRTAADGIVIEARDFDCRTRRWSLPQTVKVRQTALLDDGVFAALLKAFSPIARIETDANRQVVLNGRASGVPLNDRSLTWFRPGQIAIPILRRNDRDGNPKENGIQEVPWTYILVDNVDSPEKITCQVHSGTRNPLNVRRRGRIDQLALVVNETKATTRLVLQSRKDSSVGLAGYEVYTSKPGEKTTTLVGTTDRTGAIEIAPSDQTLQVLFVKNGGELLARLPLVPGIKKEAIAPIPNDEPRLRAEGRLRGLRERMVDIVARREILIARINRLVENGDLETAKEFFDELDALPTRKPLTAQVDALQASSVTDDPRVKAQIDRMFVETRNMLAKYLDPRQINDVRTELNRARAGG